MFNKNIKEEINIGSTFIAGPYSQSVNLTLTSLFSLWSKKTFNITAIGIIEGNN